MPNRQHTQLKRSDEWGRAKWACDLWTAAFFSPLTEKGIGAVPTTDHVWQAARGRELQGRVPAVTKDLALTQPFFHWSLEFPEVFSGGQAHAGFDVMLGNPPWERIKLQEKEFFATRDRAIAEAANKAAREQLIKALASTDAPAEKRPLARAWEAAKHASECEGKFVRESARYPLTASGDINTYAIFAETFLKSVRNSGRAGFIVHSNIFTDDTTKEFFQELMRSRRLVSFFDMVNLEGIFPGIHRTHPHFCLLTISGQPVAESPVFSFYNTRPEHLSDERRRFTLSESDVALLNPDTLTAPIFRSNADAELTRKIYRHVPILIDERKGGHGNPWQFKVHTRVWHMAEDAAWFRTETQLVHMNAQEKGSNWETPEGDVWVPLFEAKMMHQYDHRWTAHTKNVENSDEGVEKLPRYWVPKDEVDERLSKFSWTHQWLIGWRNITNATNERTVIAAAFPRVGAGHSIASIFPGERNGPNRIAALLATLSTLVFDYLARQKIGGTNLSYYIVKQLPVLPPDRLTETHLQVIAPRVAELVCTSEDMRSFAEGLGFHGRIFEWNPERRASLRAELDTYFAYLYGLTRRELEYILDPKAVMGEDYPSETFRVLKENETKEFGEYRTQRLVLEAWDRFVADGTFDPARLREPQYIDRVAEELTATRAKLEQIERDSKRLLTAATATPQPTLFVEGEDDRLIIEAAWAAFFPGEPIPVNVIAAQGTKQMGSLAGAGKALSEVLGDRVVLALADNDWEGRKLVVAQDGKMRYGGVWRRFPNGIHWCLLKPTADFATAMTALQIPPENWPFTIEAAFAPALRRQALTAGAYGFSGVPQAELTNNPQVARRLFTLLPTLGPENDVSYYVMAPTPEAKDAFAAWVTAPERRIEENYAAFEEIVRGLRRVLVQDDAALVRGAA
jgi:hypothetical protein